MTETNQIAYLLYDSECGHCTFFMKIAKCFDFHDRIVPIPLKNDLSLDLVRDKISNEELMSSFHMVEIEKTGKHNLASGGDGLIELLKFIPITRKIASVAGNSPSFRALTRSLYSALARLRGNTCRSG